MPDLLAVFMIGLLGSAHCVGMCGGFALLLTQRPGSTGRRQIHQVVYFSGKTLTYILFGVLAGGSGGAIAHLLAGWQNVLSVVLGVFLLWIGLGLVGMLPAFRGPTQHQRWRGLSNAFSFFLKRGGYTGTLGVGLVNGLLPCGLVYAILAQAASTGSLLGGALTMAVFGLSTIPALYLVTLLGTMARPVWRRRFNLASGILVIVLGLVTMARGIPAMNTSHDSHGVMPEAYHEAAPDHHGRKGLNAGLLTGIATQSLNVRA